MGRSQGRKKTGGGGREAGDRKQESGVRGRPPAQRGGGRHGIGKWEARTRKGGRGKMGEKMFAKSAKDLKVSQKSVMKLVP